MNLAIKGHPKRGNEVIEILEMLGGKNSNHCTGFYINRIYFINKNGYIESTDDIKLQLYSATYYLEKFEEKFPYKVGDKVVYKTYGIHSKIKSMLWNEEKEQVFYRLESNKLFVATVDELKPLKEETMEEIYITRIGFNGDKAKLILTDGYEFITEEKDVYIIKKKPQYPKTYEECCDILDIYPIYNKPNLCICEWYSETREMHEHYSKLANLSQKDIAFMILRICRDTYWKIAGEEMGFDKPWEPNYTDDNVKYIIGVHKNHLDFNITIERNYILIFPTEEIRDYFYEKFKDLIEQCKELL